MIYGVTLRYYQDDSGAAYALIIEHGSGDLIWRYRHNGYTLDYDAEVFDSLEGLVYSIPSILYQRSRITEETYNDYYEKTKGVSQIRLSR